MRIQDPFVLYRLPQEIEYHLIIDREVKSIENLNLLQEDAFIMAPFDSSSIDKLWAFGLANTKVLNDQELAELTIETTTSPSLGKPYITDKEEHISKVNQMISLIKNGGISKGVLSRIISYPRKNKELQDLFKQLCNHYPNAFVYVCSLPNGEIWSGASPETLAHYKNPKMHTMALAGTQVIAEKSIEELVWEPKEKQEQQWVQNHIIDILKAKNISFQKSEDYSSRAGHLAHLRTDFNFNTDHKQAHEILNELHPTPAICGTPTSKAKNIILQLEGHDRKYYSGYLGLFSSDYFQLFVNLRCMQIQADNYYLYVG
ncbi:MAG: hypothetical protein GQ527_05170, partial [Bacteroidales bacterium]|nr:hypothetical protein [Bacteroidales bacterium]